MYKSVNKKIIDAKLNIEPFPYFVVKNMIPKNKLEELNKILPDFNDVNAEDALTQGKLKTKKTILPDNKIYKKMSQTKIFNEINTTLKKIQPSLIKKFQKQIQTNIIKKYQKAKLDYHLAFSVMKKSYIKNPHLDRRDHMIHALFYPSTKSNSGGDLIINKLKNKKKVYDIFPPSKDLKKHKKYKVEKNFCIFILNVPWSYHSVDKYKGSKERKYLYFVYDFKIKNSGAKTSNRKKGFNKNKFWNDFVKVKSKKRRKIFLTE